MMDHLAGFQPKKNCSGNCCFKKDDIEKAKEIYMVALENDASCVEALYNLRYK